MCECSNDTIERECGRNAAGIKPYFAVACDDEVDSIGAATDHAVSTVTMRAADTDPVVAAGKFHKWSGKRIDGDFKSEQNTETGMWNTTSKLFIPKLTAAKSAILNNLGEDNSHVVVTDMNGAKRYVGEKDNPANVKVTEQTTPRNGYVIDITWESDHSPYFYTGADVTTL
jgi:hypothetical protein